MYNYAGWTKRLKFKQRNEEHTLDVLSPVVILDLEVATMEGVKENLLKFHKSRTALSDCGSERIYLALQRGKGSPKEGGILINIDLHFDFSNVLIRVGFTTSLFREAVPTSKEIADINYYTTINQETIEQWGDHIMSTLVQFIQQNNVEK